MSFCGTEIFTCKHKQDLTKISIYDYDTDESIELDLTEKQLEILYDVIYRIREYAIFPVTCEFSKEKDNEIWSDKK